MAEHAHTVLRMLDWIAGSNVTAPHQTEINVIKSAGESLARSFRIYGHFLSYGTPLYLLSQAITPKTPTILFSTFQLLPLLSSRLLCEIAGPEIITPHAKRHHQTDRN